MVVTKKVKRPIEPETALKIIEGFVEFENWKVLTVAPGDLLRAVKINVEYGVPYWDAQLLAVMDAGGIRTVITENEKDFKRVPWVTVIDPLS